MRTSAARLVTVIAYALLLIACQATGPVTSSPSPLAATPSSTTTATPSGAVGGAPWVVHSNGRSDAWRGVALGDSDTTGSGAPTGKGWVDYYAQS